jgi:hypothetical protein
MSDEEYTSIRHVGCFGMVDLGLANYRTEGAGLKKNFGVGQLQVHAVSVSWLG